jgi:ABC-type glycerol-3-phosphate transport system substrate-binding protein
MLTAIAMALTLMMAGCTSSGNQKQVSPSETIASTKSSTIPTNKNYEIKLMDWQGQNPPYQAAYENAIKAYMKQHPNVKIEHIYQPLANDGYTKLLDTQFVSHNAPDAMQLDAPMIKKYTDQEYILGLDGYLDQPTPYSGGKKWIDTFIGGEQALLKAKTNNRFATISFIPVDGGPGLNANRPFFYNKDLLQKAGITDIPKTWKEFIEACKKLKAAGITPVAADNNRWLNWINTWTGNQFGENYVSQFFDKKYDNITELYDTKRHIGLLTGKLNGNEPISNAVIDLLKDFSQYWQEGWAGANEQAAQQLFMYQKAAFLLDGNWNYGFYKDNIKSFTWDVMPFPLITKETSPYAEEAFPKGTGDISVYGWGLNKDLEKDKDKLQVILDFFGFITGKIAQDEFVDIAVSNSPIVGVHVPEAMKPFMETDKNKLKVPAGNSLYNEADTAVRTASSHQFYSGKINKEQYISALKESGLKMTTKITKDAVDEKTGLSSTIVTVQKQISDLQASNAPQTLIDAKKKSLEILKQQLELYNQYAVQVLK